MRVAHLDALNALTTLDGSGSPRSPRCRTRPWPRRSCRRPTRRSPTCKPSRRSSSSPPGAGACGWVTTRPRCRRATASPSRPARRTSSGPAPTRPWPCCAGARRPTATRRDDVRGTAGGAQRGDRARLKRLATTPLRRTRPRLCPPRGYCCPAPADERKRAELELLPLRAAARRGPGGLRSDIHRCTVEI
jgi:hypothetical protein